MSAMKPHKATHGRHPRLSDRVFEGLVEAARIGAPIQTACRALGVAPATVREWMQIGAGQQLTWHQGSPVSAEHQERCAALFEAVGRAHAEMELEALKIIREAGLTPDKNGKIDWRAPAWILEHAPWARDRYGQHVKIEDTREVERSPVYEVFPTMSRQEKFKALPAEFQDLVGANETDVA